jgi:hypothetical protein
MFKCGTDSIPDYFLNFGSYKYFSEIGAVRSLNGTLDDDNHMTVREGWNN